MNKFSDNPVYSFDDCVAAQKPYKEQFVEWLESRPKIQEVKVANRDDDLKGIDFFVLIEEEFSSPEVSWFQPNSAVTSAGMGNGKEIFGFWGQRLM